MSAEITEVQAYLARDVDAAFADFVRTFQDEVYSGVLRLVSNTDDAADVTQDTFVRAYSALTGYSPKRIRQLKLRGWLWTIALNCCRNRARAHRRRPRMERLDGERVPPDGAPGPEDVALGRCADLVWRHRLAVLPEGMRIAVVLRHVAGLGYEEIAIALDRPTGSVKADVHRGLSRLRESVETERDSGGDR